jgi:REP element-mobilizing transposase RayT
MTGDPQYNIIKSPTEATDAPVKIQFMKAETFFEKEQFAEFLLKNNGPFWHMYTPGNLTSVLFVDKEDFKFAMNLVAQVAAKNPEIRIYTFEVMNNHFHFILSGEEEQCRALFELLKEKLERYLRNKGRNVNLSKFNCSLIRIMDLKTLRNEIIYVNRNGYVARHDCTPFSYPWGAGMAIFNPVMELIPKQDYSKLTVRDKREICKSKDIDLPGNLKVCDGVILPSSYCAIKESEQLFRDPHHYFSLLSKNWEAYSEIAKRLGDTVIITDEEMYGAVSSLCAKEYGIKNPVNLNPTQKIELAKRMKCDYFASNKQIKGILRLDIAIVEELFGH